MVKLDEITDKVKDKKGSNNLKWKLKFKHESNNIDCEHCLFKEREESIPKDKYEIKNMKGDTITINKITVIRGSLDDCIGWRAEQ